MLRMPPSTMTATATAMVDSFVTSQPNRGAANRFAAYATAATVMSSATVYIQPDMNA